jgi:hypothetical protein
LKQSTGALDAAPSQRTDCCAVLMGSAPARSRQRCRAFVEKSSEGLVAIEVLWDESTLRHADADAATTANPTTRMNLALIILSDPQIDFIKQPPLSAYQMQIERDNSAHEAGNCRHTHVPSFGRIKLATMWA